MKTYHLIYLLLGGSKKCVLRPNTFYLAYKIDSQYLDFYLNIHDNDILIMKNKYYVCVLPEKFKTVHCCLKIQQEIFRVVPSISAIC